MSNEELEYIAELIFQKLLEKEQQYIEMELPTDYDKASHMWYSFNPSEYASNKELLIDRLVALNIEKLVLIEQENYEELIKLQKEIDEIKEQLKQYKN